MAAIERVRSAIWAWNVSVPIGITIGLARSLSLARALRSLRFETTAFDRIAFISASTDLTFVALVASLVPAEMVAKIDLIFSLRAD